DAGDGGGHVPGRSLRRRRGRGADADEPNRPSDRGDTQRFPQDGGGGTAVLDHVYRPALRRVGTARGRPRLPTGDRRPPPPAADGQARGREKIGRHPEPRGRSVPDPVPGQGSRKATTRPRSRAPVASVESAAAARDRSISTESPNSPSSPRAGCPK